MHSTAQGFGTAGSAVTHVLHSGEALQMQTHNSMRAHLWGHLLLGIKTLLVPWGLFQVRWPPLPVVIAQMPPLGTYRNGQRLRLGT